MGYWEQNREGHSFAQDERVTSEDQQMIWGDSPADIMADAIWQIKIAFLRDMGRLPSKAEVIAGIKFTTNVLDELPDWPEDCQPITPEQHAVVTKYGYTATGGDVGLSDKQLDAIDKINGVLEEVQKAP